MALYYIEEQIFEKWWCFDESWKNTFATTKRNAMGILFFMVFDRVFNKIVQV